MGRLFANDPGRIGSSGDRPTRIQYCSIMEKVLHLASWYPNKNSIQEGDFVQRQIEAISLFNPTEIVFVTKDLKNTGRGEFIVINTKGQLKETLIYYHPLRTGIPVIDKLLSNIKYLQIYKR